MEGNDRDQAKQGGRQGGRKRKAPGEEKEQQLQQQQRPSAPQVHPMFSATGGTLAANFTLDPSSSTSAFSNVAGASAAAAVAASRGIGTETSQLQYGGNIAAACEAANQEAAKKQSETSQQPDNADLQRKKAASRITAWQSRERKRIEMEVLQERKSELTRRNADLKNENEQLRLLTARLRTVVANPSIQRTLQQQQQQLQQSQMFSQQQHQPAASFTQELLARRASDFFRTELSAQPNILEALSRRSSLSAGSNPVPPQLQGYDLSSVDIVAAALGLQQPLQQQQQQQQQTLSSLAPSSNPFSFGLSGNTMINQNQQIQQRPEGRGPELPSNIHPSQFSLPNTLLGLQDMISPLTRQQQGFSGNRFVGMNQPRQMIVPLQRQEDIMGNPPMNISSFAAPAALTESKHSEAEDSKKEPDPKEKKGSAEQHP